MRQVEVPRALGRKYPEGVVLVSCIDAGGRPNIITLGWSMATSGVPPMLAISIAPQRYSHDLVRDSGEFVLAFPTEEMAEAALLCGTKSGRDVDKFAEARIEAIPAIRVRPPLLGGCIANFECVVRGAFTTGDHTIFAGEILCAHVGESIAGRLYTLGPNHKMGGVREAPGSAKRRET